VKLRNIPIEQIVITKNIRSEADDELGGLMDSIDKYDVLQPVLVVPRDGRYELLAGHRRFRAVQMRGDATIPCIVRDNIPERDIPLIKIIENVQRKQMSPHELVAVFEQMLAATPGLTKKGLAKMLGKSDAWVYDKYKADKIYTELLECGLSAGEVDDLSEGDLKRLSHVLNRAERAGIARIPSTQGRARATNRADSYTIERRGPQKRTDLTGGFRAFYGHGKTITLICESLAVREQVMQSLLELKERRAKATA